MINVEAITKAELAALSDIDQSTKIAVVGALQDLPKNAGAKLDDASVTAIALEIPKIVKTLAEADMRSRPEYQGLIRKLGPAIASAKTPPADAQTAAIRDAVKAGLADPKADARKGVLEVLPALTAIAGREAAAVELLRPLLKDADPNIRAVAFTTLWSSPATVQAGGDALKAELKEISKGWVADLAKPEIPVRESAAWALCWTSPEDADAALTALRALKDEPNAGVKRRVAKAIESLEAAKASASWPEPSWPPFRSGPPPQVPAAGGAGGGGPPG